MRGLRLAAAVGICGLVAFYAGTRAVRPAVATHPITHRAIAGIATNAEWMDRSSRETDEAPDRALTLVGITAGMTVADVGAGSGYMTMRLASLVGSTGRVYATDIQPALLAIVRQKAEAAHASEVTTVLGSATDAKLPPHALDVALLVDVYHEFQRPVEMLRSIRGALKTDGRLVLIEYRAEDPAIPIAPTHRLSVNDARAEIEREGFTLVQVIDALPRQHIIVFTLRGA